MRPALTPKKFQMFLNDRQVAHYFGSRPELGKRIGLGTVRVEIASPSQSFRKQNPTSKIDVGHVVALRPIKPGRWEVHCTEENYERVVSWLQQRCVEQPHHPKRKRKEQKHSSVARWQGNNWL